MARAASSRRRTSESRASLGCTPEAGRRLDSRILAAPDSADSAYAAAAAADAADPAAAAGVAADAAADVDDVRCRLAAA